MNKTLYLIILLFISKIAVSQIFHRCGTTSSYADKTGIIWAGDKSYSAGSWGYTNAGAGVASTTDIITGTADIALYQTERYGVNIGYQYDELKNGIYNVTIKFSELYWTEKSKRIFDIVINDILVLENFDIFSLVGHDHAIDYNFYVKVTQGTIRISVPRVNTDNAKFAAISITPTIKDQISPIRPQGLNGFRNNNNIVLNWKRNTEPDLQGYNLYRTEKQEGPFLKINNEIIKSMNSEVTFTDSSILPEKVFYKVSAIDASDNESTLSDLAEIKTKKNTGNFWDVPKCAWEIPMGYHPPGATGRTKRGIPLGGIGAGNFMYNLCGTFGPWEFKTGLHEEKFLSQAAFHVYEKVKGQVPAIKTLATEDVLPKWNRLSISEGSYFALYPKAWFNYNTFVTDISLKQFTPIIPHNYRESSYPCGIFQFKLYNPTNDTIEVSIMFTFPNASYGNDLRSGYSTRLFQENGVTALLLKSSSTGNPNTTKNTEWCIAAKDVQNGKITFAKTWNGNSDGSDIYNSFSRNGELDNNELDISNSAGAIAIKVNLPPKVTSEIPIVLSWNFPIVKFQNTEWYRKYTEYFFNQENNSYYVAQMALNNYKNWESKVDDFMNLIINEPLYPDWLKQCALNELYYDTFGGVFWENGCITKPNESTYGTLSTKDHKYFSMECQDYAMCETFDVRHYECRHYLELWPEIEKDVLKWFADYTFNDPFGRTPHDEGAPNADPFFIFSGYGADWQDMPSKLIQQIYAYYYKTKDKDFLDFVWGACKKTYNFMKTRDLNGNGIPDFGNTTYDTWGLSGDNLLCGGLWIGALEAMEKLAIIQKEAGLLIDIQNNITKSKLMLDILFWRNDLNYFKIDGSNSAIMADGLNGQRFCETTDLDPITSPEKIKSHLDEVFKRCVVPLKDYNGDGIGDMGAANGRRDDGSKINNQQGDEVWTGTSYFIAAQMYHWGKIFNDQSLLQKALQTAYGVYYQTWINEKTAYFFNTPEAWSVDEPAKYRAQQYQRPRAVWELLLEIKNPFKDYYATSINKFSDIPVQFKLSQNYPNPFNSTTNIKYSIPFTGNVKIKIYNINGQLVQTLIDGNELPGIYSIKWDAKVASGVYLCTLEAFNASKYYFDSIKLLLVK